MLKVTEGERVLRSGCQAVEGPVTHDTESKSENGKYNSAEEEGREWEGV